LSVLKQSGKMSAFESAMKSRPSLPPRLSGITAEFCALLVRVSIFPCVLLSITKKGMYLDAPGF
jgi:hypothetical protein